MTILFGLVVLGGFVAQLMWLPRSRVFRVFSSYSQPGRQPPAGPR